MGMLPTIFAPLALVGWALLALVWQLQRKGVRGSPVWLACGATFVHFWCASPLGANLMVRAIEGDPSQPRPCQASGAGDVVVALAGGARRADHGEPQLARLKEESFRRTVAAAALARSLAPASLVVSGGAGGRVTEAHLMSELAVALDVPPAQIVVEATSGNTHQSAVAVARIVHALEGKRVHVFTSALHMPRAAGALESQGLVVCRHPVDWRQVRAGGLGRLVPQSTAVAKTTEVFEEVLGYVWYRLSGRIGHAARPAATGTRETR